MEVAVSDGGCFAPLRVRLYEENKVRLVSPYLKIGALRRVW